MTTSDSETCGAESKMMPGKFCNRPPHPGHNMHVFSRPSSDDAPTQYGVACVTVPLPINALMRLRDYWMNKDDHVLKDNAVMLIRDIFDGQDGHLVRIDAALEGL